MVVAMILAGGVGSRVGAKVPKQFVEVESRPIIAYTLDIFENNDDIDVIEIVCHKDWKNYLNEVIKINEYKKIRWITDGGCDFQKSVMNGLDRIDREVDNEDVILIHYAAAPFTSSDIVHDVVRVAREKGSAFSATPCFQLMGTNDGDISKKWINRDDYVQIASPYAFNMAYLRNVYMRARENGLLEDTDPHVTSLVHALGDYIYQAKGNQMNIKITTEEDIELFRYYVKGKMNDK